ncbi:transposase-like protein [Rhizobium leguminosarum]
MENTLEVLTTRKSGRKVHRQWPDEVKAQIISESLRPGAMVMRSQSAMAAPSLDMLADWRGFARARYSTDPIILLLASNSD